MAVIDISPERGSNESQKNYRERQKSVKQTVKALRRFGETVWASQNLGTFRYDGKRIRPKKPMKPKS